MMASITEGNGTEGMRQSNFYLLTSSDTPEKDEKTIRIGRKIGWVKRMKRRRKRVACLSVSENTSRKKID